MQKYIIFGKTSQETAASMLNKPQNRRTITEPLAEAFGAKFIEFFDSITIAGKKIETMKAMQGLSEQAMAKVSIQEGSIIKK